MPDQYPPGAYCIVTSLDQFEFVDKVNSAISLGWHCQGGAFCGWYFDHDTDPPKQEEFFMQAMTRPWLFPPAKPEMP